MQEVGYYKHSNVTVMEFKQNPCPWSGDSKSVEACVIQFSVKYISGKYLDIVIFPEVLVELELEMWSI
jgi:hypothetical protein